MQFTPDLMPSDILGAEVLDESGSGKRSFRFISGPVFAQLLMADEINRASPRTQSALLQAMQEQRVAMAGIEHVLPQPFHVLATQNPIEQEGTYPLPEAQLDRFLLEVHVGYPSEGEEREIARRTTSGALPKVPRALGVEDLRKLQGLVPRMPVTDAALDLAVRLARTTRPDDKAAPSIVTRYVRFGAGPRGSQALVLAAKARAALRGEAAVEPEDVRALAVAVLRHRLVLSYRAEADGVRDVDVVRGVEEALR
ncbi:MAG: AAA family ATPase [Polyangiales bacterium]